MTWDVRVHPDAQPELDALDTRERLAADHAMEKLQEIGPTLPYPHSSAVMNSDRIRELRPRRGNSRTRLFYRQVDDVIFVVAAVGPEADVDQRGFKRAVQRAKQRLDELKEED